MSKNRNGLLGVGGQRKKVSRDALRGKPGGGPHGATDPIAQKKELLRKLQERSQRKLAEQSGD